MQSNYYSHDTEPTASVPLYGDTHRESPPSTRSTRSFFNARQLPRNRARGSRRTSPSATRAQGDMTSSAAVTNYPPNLGHDRRGNRSSATWTTSSGDMGLFSDTDEIDERSQFVQEYNRLAKKHEVRLLVPEDYEETSGGRLAPCQGRRSWFSRTFLRQTSSTRNAGTTKPDKSLRHKRSVSDLAMHLMHPKKDGLKDEDLQSLVRLCGKSILYLPSEYSPSSLVLPTCFRATAQFLVQHAADTRGVFRVPGAVRVVNLLYEYYSADKDGYDITGTIRCPNLPTHINVGVHDVASTFKKFLAGLPGGILGSLSLFDAMVAIHSQLRGDPEFNRTKQSKLRARLIALAIGTLKSQFRRELICAVFGLLSLIGRTAELTPREDEHGRPLPTSDLMGYNALGIVFGPLLVGDLIKSYTMKLASPSAGLVLFPMTPPKTRKEKKKNKNSEEPFASLLTVDKIHVANSIAEMVITHWREVVKHMKSLGVLRTFKDGSATERKKKRSWMLRPSASESFVLRKPPDWERTGRGSQMLDTSGSPTPRSPTPSSRFLSTTPSQQGKENVRDTVSVKRQRPKSSRSASSHRILTKPSLTLLSPTAEESIVEDPPGPNVSEVVIEASRSRIPFASVSYGMPMEEPRRGFQIPIRASETGQVSPMRRASKSILNTENVHQDQPLRKSGDIPAAESLIHPALRPRASGASGVSFKAPNASDGSLEESDPVRSPGKTSLQGKAVLHQTSPRHSEASALRAGGSQSGRTSLSSKRGVVRLQGKGSAASQITHPKGSNASNVISGEGSRRHPLLGHFQDPRSVPGAVGASASTLQKENPSSLGDSSVSETIDGPRAFQDFDVNDQTKLPGQVKASFGPAVPASRISKHNGKDHGESGEQSREEVRTLWSSQNQKKRLSFPPGNESDGEDSNPRRGNSHDFDLSLSSKDNYSKKLAGGLSDRNSQDSSSPTSVRDWMGQKTPTKCRDRRATGRHGDKSRRSSHKLGDTSQTPSKGEVRTHTGIKDKSKTPPLEPSATPPSGKHTQPILEGQRLPTSKAAAAKSMGGAVKAMAAMFDNAAKDSPFVPTPIQTAKARRETKTGTLVSRYTVNTSPTKSARSSRSDSISSVSTSPRLGGGGSTRTEEDKTGRVVTPGRRTLLATSASENAAQRSVVRTSEEPRTPTRAEKFGLLSLRPTTKMPRPVAKTPSFEQPQDQDLDHPPSLGKMVAPPEQPPVSYHINFSRPTSAAAAAAAVQPLFLYTGSPSPGGSNSVLHAQIRHLQKQLDAKTDEAAQLRRQLETRENMDIGLLSEQLRAAKRECAVWRDRAEAAERRVKAFERFTARIRGLRERNIGADGDAQGGGGDGVGPQETKDGEAGCGRQTWRAMRRPSSSLHTEDGNAVAQRIRNSLREMDGAASTSDEDGNTEGEGGGDAVEDNDANSNGTTVVHGRLDIAEAAVEIWTAALELLEYDDMTTGVSTNTSPRVATRRRESF